MNSLRVMTLLTLVALTSCGLYESMGGIPHAERKLAVPAGTQSQLIFNCAEESIRSIPEPSNWNKEVTKRDLEAGVMDVGGFDEKNVIGFRARVTVNDKRTSIAMKIKGAGPYYTDLGVDGAADKLLSAMKKCLAVQRK